MGVYYLDGDYVEAGAAALPVSDLALLRGYGIFDFLRTYGGVPFQLGAHLRRLARSAQLLEMALPWDIEELGEIVMETLHRNDYAEANIRIVVSGGDSQNDFLPCGNPRLLVMVTPWRQMDPGWYERGAAVATVEMARDLPEAKSTHYIPGIRAQKQALRRVPAAIEAIYRFGQRVIEGTRSNTFMYKDGAWATPDRDLLPGITRAEVIKLMRARGALQLRDITLEEYYDADEIILTSSSKEIVPIVRVDDRTIGAGRPGDNTRRLMRSWRMMTERYAAT